MEHTLIPTNQPPDTNDHVDVGEAVVTAVAEAQGISALEVHPPLATVVDPDSLNDLISSMTSEPKEASGLVEFAYSGHLISISADGDVTATERGAAD